LIRGQQYMMLFTKTFTRAVLVIEEILRTRYPNDSISIAATARIDDGKPTDARQKEAQEAYELMIAEEQREADEQSVTIERPSGDEDWTRQPQPQQEAAQPEQVTPKKK